MNCLFLIDVQNGFVSPRTAHVVPRLLRLAAAFRQGPVLATRFVNTDGGPYERFMGWQRLKASPEIDLAPGIAAAAHRVVDKNIYSACTPEVVAFLRENRITQAYIAGIDTDCCVLKTATDLFELGVRPVVLADCCASNGGASSHEAALRVMERTIGPRQLLAGELPPEVTGGPGYQAAEESPRDRDALPPELDALREQMAEHVHDVWAAGRRAQGWTWGPRRDDGQKEHPCLVDYDRLPEEEKEYDRRTAEETLRFILGQGYRLLPPEK